MLELGAGTGKLTEQLVALGHDVHATDPDAAMLEILRRGCPAYAPPRRSPRRSPAPTASYDVVVGAQCFHWFDLDRALPEIARVLKPGGSAGAGLEPARRADPLGAPARAGSSAPRSRSTTRARSSSSRCGSSTSRPRRSSTGRTSTASSIQDLVRSRSNVAVLDDEARAAEARGGARVLRRLRPRHGRHAAALRHPLLPGPGDQEPGAESATRAGAGIDDRGRRCRRAAHRRRQRRRC